MSTSSLDAFSAPLSIVSRNHPRGTCPSVSHRLGWRGLSLPAARGAVDRIGAPAVRAPAGPGVVGADRAVFVLPSRTVRCRQAQRCRILGDGHRLIRWRVHKETVASLLTQRGGVLYLHSARDTPQNDHGCAPRGLWDHGSGGVGTIEECERLGIGRKIGYRSRHRAHRHGRADSAPPPWRRTAVPGTAPFSTVSPTAYPSTPAWTIGGDPARSGRFSCPRPMPRARCVLGWLSCNREFSGPRMDTNPGRHCRTGWSRSDSGRGRAA